MSFAQKRDMVGSRRTGSYRLLSVPGPHQKRSVQVLPNHAGRILHVSSVLPATCMLHFMETAAGCKWLILKLTCHGIRVLSSGSDMLKHVSVLRV